MPTDLGQTIRPYVEQLLDDSEVQDHLSRSVANLRAARRRASKGSLTDQTLRRRIATSAREALLANTALQQAKEKQERRDRRRRRGAFGLLLVTGVVAYLAVDASARERAFETVLDVLGRPETGGPA